MPNFRYVLILKIKTMQKEDNSGKEDEEKELSCVPPLPRYSTLRTPSITRNEMAWHETAEKLTSPSQPLQIDLTNLASVSAADLKILKTAAQVAEQAEVGTGGFNDELAANGNADDTALQNGKIKNKVLKLQLQVLALQVEAAQGDADQAKLDEETTKLNKNVQLDVAAKGQKSVGVTGTFAG